MGSRWHSLSITIIVIVGLFAVIIVILISIVFTDMLYILLLPTFIPLFIFIASFPLMQLPSRNTDAEADDQRSVVRPSFICTLSNSHRCREQH